MLKQRIFAALTASALLLSLTACGGSADTAQDTQDAQNAQDAAADTAASTEVIVFAAASLTETLTQIAEDYKAVAPDVTLTFSFDSSGTLRDQILAGSDCDLFLSAGQSQMNDLDSTSDKNSKDGDCIDPDTRVNLLENKVTLVVPDGNPANVSTFADMVNCSLVALGNDSVPVGQYSTEILTNLGILDELESAGKISYGSNVKEVTKQVQEGAVDCGIIYATDAFSAGLTVVDEATSDLCGQVVYPAAVCKDAQHPTEAQAFLDYLGTDAAMDVFSSVGFAKAE